jgi:hypothetical protein
MQRLEFVETLKYKAAFILGHLYPQKHPLIPRSYFGKGMKSVLALIAFHGQHVPHLYAKIAPSFFAVGPTVASRQAKL